MSTGSGPSFAAGRVAFTLDLKGACAAIDTACSSSLVAAHLARNGLRLIGGEHTFAVVVGVGVVLGLDVALRVAKLGALSPVGRCKTLDTTADGYGRSEGCAAIVLVAEDTSLNDGYLPVEDVLILALASTATNQDGRSSSLTTPNGISQQTLVRDALGRIDESDTLSRFISLALHGTGTPLGDPIEVAALASVFSTQANAPLIHLAAPKSTLGHGEGAAGMHSLLSVSQALKMAYYATSIAHLRHCLLYTSPSPRDLSTSRMPSSA